MTYPGNLTPFFESVKVRPLLQGSTIQVGNDTFTVDRWFRSLENHCYVFIDKSNKWAPFAKKPSDVAAQIKDKVIIVTKYA